MNGFYRELCMEIFYPLKIIRKFGTEQLTLLVILKEAIILIKMAIQTAFMVGAKMKKAFDYYKIAAIRRKPNPVAT